MPPINRAQSPSQLLHRLLFPPPTLFRPNNFRQIFKPGRPRPGFLFSAYLPK
jgi:hypothetical protein